MKTIFVALAVVGLLLVGGVYFFAFHKVPDPTAPIETVAYVPPPAAPGLPEGTALYKDKERAFLLAYPQELSVLEHKEREGARTIVFEERSGEGKGFQIFIVPYKDAQITQSRIVQDTRGTAFGDVQEVVVGEGVRALIFYSRHSLLGELREVWFIRDGYLYEVTTYKDLDTWLANILKELRFEASG